MTEQAELIPTEQQTPAANNASPSTKPKGRGGKQTGAPVTIRMVDAAEQQLEAANKKVEELTKQLEAAKKEAAAARTELAKLFKKYQASRGF